LSTLFPNKEIFTGENCPFPRILPIIGDIAKIRGKGIFTKRAEEGFYAVLVLFPLTHKTHRAYREYRVE